MYTKVVKKDNSFFSFYQHLKNVNLKRLFNPRKSKDCWPQEEINKTRTRKDEADVEAFNMQY
uniref:Putative ovule protein n=1 Tax=Solanum chacoense TaxID=4108 RepID=A0A0V0H1X4_SOLCH